MRGNNAYTNERGSRDNDLVMASPTIVSGIICYYEDYVMIERLKSNNNATA